jgi:hypothetical protein
MAVGPRAGNRPMAVSPWEGSRLTAVWLREGSRLTAAAITMSPEVPACWEGIGRGHRIQGVSSEYDRGGGRFV